MEVDISEESEKAPNVSMTPGPECLASESNHDDSLLLLPLPLPAPQLTQSGRPQRQYQLPKRFHNNLPEPAALLPPKTGPANCDSGTATRITWVILIVRDRLVSALNSFGLWRDYPERPTFDPDSNLTLEDLATPHRKSESLHFTTPISNDLDLSNSASAHHTYWPFPNPTIHGVMKWLNNGKTVKSEAEITHFVQDVILAPEFQKADLIDFDAHRENQRLDKALSKDTLHSQFHESTIEILVPSGDINIPPRLFSVPGLLYQNLTSVIRDAFTGPLSHLLHFSPYKLFHKLPITGEAEWVYGEIYTSDAFLNKTEQVRRHGQLPPNNHGCVREKVVAAVMFASDVTQLTQFGDTKAWPIYFMPGNLSKYVRAKPDSGGLIHLAYIPTVSI